MEHPQHATSNGNGCKKALIYCRVSTTNQEKEGTSLDSQVEACTKYALALGYSIGRITKEVYSGAELYDRPKLARDRTDLAAGDFQALICYSTDRLSRDPIHLAIIALELERVGVELIFVTEPMDKSDEAGLIRYVKGYAAKMEREKFRERSLRGKQARILAGKIHGSGIDLYGYRRDKEAGVRVVYEPEAAIVRRIYQWIGEEALGVKSIARRLNEQNVPPPAASKINFSDGRTPVWNGEGVRRIARDSTYKGKGRAWRHKQLGRNGRMVLRPDSEQIALPESTSPAIVSVEVWRAVQEHLSANRGESARNETHPFLLRGHIYCANCGLRMVSSTSHGRGFYRCSSVYAVGKACGVSYVPASECEEWAFEEIAEDLRNPERIASELKRREGKVPDPQLTSDLEAARRHVEEINRRIQRYVRRFGDADEDILPLIERELAQARKQREQAESTMQDLEKRLAVQQQSVTMLRDLFDYCEQVRSRLDQFTFEQKRLLLRAVGARVVANGRHWHVDRSLPPAGIVTESC
ncbi:MAG: recombinase family protein [Blastocatellia bacterium]